MIAAVAADRAQPLVQSAINRETQKEPCEDWYGIDFNAVDGELPDSDFRLVVHSDCAVIQPRKRASSPIESRAVTTRGNVTDFSRKSRKRMIEMMAKIRNLDEPLFVTLTYPDQEWFARSRTPRDFQKHLDLFWKRLNYTMPGVRVIWRKEYKTRKSGPYQGDVAPHCHMIVSGWTGDLAQVSRSLREAWSQVIGTTDRGRLARVDVQVAKSRKHAYSYLSKYVAKVNDDDQGEAQKISEFFHKWTGEIGRHWGYRGEWDTGASVELPLTDDQAVQLKRLVRAWMKSKGKKKTSRMLGRIRPGHALTVLGLGDQDTGWTHSRLVDFYAHACDLAAHVRQNAHRHMSNKTWRIALASA